MTQLVQVMDDVHLATMEDVALDTDKMIRLLNLIVLKLDIDERL